MKIRVSVSTIKLGSTVERIMDIEDEDWDDADDMTRNEIVMDFIQQKCMFSYDYEVV